MPGEDTWGRAGGWARWVRRLWLLNISLGSLLLGVFSVLVSSFFLTEICPKKPPAEEILYS